LDRGKTANNAKPTLESFGRAGEKVVRVGVLVCRRELKQAAAALWAKNEKFSNAVTVRERLQQHSTLCATIRDRFL
jgi:hypothetical protein